MKSKKLILLIIIVALISGCSIYNEKNPEKKEIIEHKVEGYISIDKLPQEYSLNQIIEDGVLVFMHDENYNTNLYDEFVERLKKKQDAFLRIGNFTIEGDPIITDIIYDSKTGKTTVTTDSTRDKFASREDRKIKVMKYEYLEEHLRMTEKGSIVELIAYNGELKDDYYILLYFNVFIDWI